MRIATTQYAATTNTALQNLQTRLADVNGKLATGQRLSLPSDDPIASVRLARLTREDAALAQYRDNITSMKTRLSTSENYLDGMVGDLQRAKDLMVAAADGTNTAEDENAQGLALASLRDSLAYSVNVKDEEGRYVFSGTASGTRTVAYDANAPVGSRYAYTGNTGSQNVVVGNGVTQAANVNLSDMASLLNKLDSATAELQTPGVSPNGAGTKAILSAALDGLGSALDSVSSKIATLGSTQNLLATLDTNHANVSVANQQAMSELGNLDYADAALQLNGYTIALQATQKAYAKVASLSLFNQL